ncbi:hypothetical protein FACS1894219_03760 [Clostridia bacterium]|nr:hypothetical protein FACS1894219_03760 [Clostridia bacterium]
MCNEMFLLAPTVSQPIGQAAATVFSFVVNKLWTFESRQKFKISEAIKFLMVNSVSITINAIGINLLIQKLGMNEYLAKIPIAFITIPINYIGNKLFVFSEKIVTGGNNSDSQIDSSNEHDSAEDKGDKDGKNK